MKYKINENYFEEITTPSQAYILGFIYADGSVYPQSGLRIVIKAEDVEILKFIKKELATDIPIKIRNWKCGIYTDFCVNRKKIVQDLINLGIIVNKTYKSRSFPKVNSELFPHMLAGFFAGDGSIYKNKPKNKSYCEYTVSFSCNKYVLTDLKYFLKVYHNIHSYLRQRYNNDYSWMLEIRGSKNIKKIFNMIFANAPFNLQRKYNLFLENNINAEKHYNRSLSINKNGEKCLNLYKNGMRQIDISKELNIPYSSIRTHIQRCRKKGLCI
jgi:DNA-binding CsgD family transcriptional regulator